MKKIATKVLFLSILLCCCSGLAVAGTEVGTAVSCTQVKDKEPVGPNTAFPVDIGKVYFYTVVNTTEEPTAIAHEWYYKNNKISEVKLAVLFPRTRTWSYKTIPPEMTGDWKVRVIDAKGNLLKEGFFKILTVSMPKAMNLPQQPLVPKKGVPLTATKEQKLLLKPVDSEVHLIPKSNFEYFIKYGGIVTSGSIDAYSSYSYTTIDGGGRQSGSSKIGNLGSGFELGLIQSNRKLRLGGSLGYFYGKFRVGSSWSRSNDSNVEILDYEKLEVMQLNAIAEYLFRVFYLTSNISWTSYAEDYYYILNKSVGMISSTDGSFHYSSTFPMIGAGFGWRMFSRAAFHPLIELKYCTRVNGKVQIVSLLGGINF
jgi:hypothetical protein